MKRSTKRLGLNRETIRQLTNLRVVRGGLITGGTSGEPECPTTVGYPGCETGPGTGGCGPGGPESQELRCPSVLIFNCP